MKRILNNIRRCLYHEFLLEQQKNYRCGRNLTQKQQRGLATWKGVVEKCVERYCVLASKNSGAVKTKFQVPAWMIINPNRKNLNQLENHPDCLTLLAFGANWETRQSMVCQQTCKNSHNMDSVFRQTLGTIDCIHSSHMIFRQYCHVGNTAQHCRLGLFQDSDFAGDLEDSKSISRDVLCFFGSRHIGLHQLDVQEANISIPQFCRD